MQLFESTRRQSILVCGHRKTSLDEDFLCRSLAANDVVESHKNERLVVNRYNIGEKPM